MAAVQSCGNLYFRLRTSLLDQAFLLNKLLQVLFLLLERPPLAYCYRISGIAILTRFAHPFQPICEKLFNKNSLIYFFLPKFALSVLC